VTAVVADTVVLEREEAGLEPNEYRFINHWILPGTIEEVSAILADPVDYARWWPCAWLDYHGVSHGGRGEVGGIFEYRVKGWLPYSLRLRFTVAEDDPPHRFSVDCAGDLVGHGTWTLSEHDKGVEAVYEWRVRADWWLIRAFSRYGKPLFRSNHFWVMRHGARSLALELARRHAASPEELARIPAAPGPTFPENIRQRLRRARASAAATQPPQGITEAERPDAGT
jgi:hypothetical protein